MVGVLNNVAKVASLEPELVPRDNTASTVTVVVSDASRTLRINPVPNSPEVVISWPTPTGTGEARVAVYGFTGERLFETTVAAPTNEYVWDLTTGGGAHRVVNGAYIIVVDVDGQRYRRRLFIARPNP